jgi:hypothetical protein
LYTDPKGLYQFAASGCTVGDKDCENRYQKYKDSFKQALKELGNAADHFDKGSLEKRRIAIARAWYGEDNGKGVTIKFGSLAGSTAGETSEDGGTVKFDPSKWKTQDAAKWFAIDVGHEGTHVNDKNNVFAMEPLSPFSYEYRGYETSSFVFKALFTPAVSASTGGLSLGGIRAIELSYGFGVIWNTSWNAADKGNISSRGIGITNTVIGRHGYAPTSPANPWLGKIE